MYADFFTTKLGKENVRVVVNRERIERYQSTGIFANGKQCDFNYVDETLKTDPCDLIIFAVKGTSLESGIETAQHQIGPDTILLSVLNGISSEEILARTFGGEKVIHCVSQGMDAVRETNKLRYTRMGELRIGIDHPKKQTTLNELTTFFDETSFPYTTEVDIKHRVWKKFMLNVGVNQVVMVTEGTYGTVNQEGPEREMMIAAMREVIPVALAEGVNLTEQDLQDNLDLIAPLSAENMPSMRQDGRAKRYSEVDLFSGTVIDRAAKHAIETPVNQYLYDKVKEIEATY